MSLFKSALLYLLHNFIIQIAVCKNSSTWTLLNDTEVNYNTSVILEDSIPLMMCLLRCHNTLACIAVQVNEESSKCELLMYSPPDGMPSLTERSGWTFYEKVIRCEDSWTVFQDHCYFFGNTSLIFSDAENFCQSLDNAHLVNIETATENTFLEKYIRDRRATTHWIGMTDEETEDVWKHFPSGKNVTYFAWYNSQPNNGRASNCMVFYESYDYGWADEPCIYEYKPICEKRA